MPDGAIVIPDTAAAPKDYTLSGTQEIQLKSVRAVIDGSGAATAFLPTLQLLDPNGHVMWEGATSSTVAAGGSADVSWFPGLGGAGGGTSTLAQWFIARRTTTLTMLAGAENPIGWTDLFSSDSSLFSLQTRSGIPNGCVQVEREGVVIFNAWAHPGALEPNFVLGLFLNSVAGVSVSTWSPENQYNTLGMPALNPFVAGMMAINVPDSLPDQVFAEYHNFDAANRTLSAAQMWGVWWPIGTLSPF